MGKVSLDLKGTISSQIFYQYTYMDDQPGTFPRSINHFVVKKVPKIFFFLKDISDLNQANPFRSTPVIFIQLSVIPIIF